MLSRAVRKFAAQRASSTLVLAEVNSAGELQGTTHSGWNTFGYYQFF